MLTLRVAPPRLLSAPAVPPQRRDLMAVYFDALWRNWSGIDRAVALGLSWAALLGNAGVARSDRTVWRHGWDLREQALLAGAADCDAHLSMAARKGLHRLINPGAYPLAVNPLKNKRLFAERCRAAGLAVPDDFTGAPEALPGWIEGQDVVIAKPNFTSKGAGVEGFRRDGGGWRSAGKRLTTRHVLDRLAVVLRKGGVVQRCCRTHPDLADISPGALPTLRVMTAVNESGIPEACDRVIRFSAGGVRPVDNFNADNFVAGLDDEGRIVTAYRRVGEAVESAEAHPATGVRLSGRPIPDVAPAVALALSAHALFQDGFRVIGWDVGLTADGPVLIEGNWNPGTDILQLTSSRGLGDSRLGEIYWRHLQNVPAAGWRSARPIELEPRGVRSAVSARTAWPSAAS